MIFTLGLRLMGMMHQVVQSTTGWVLTTLGIWDDAGIWDDTRTWTEV